MIFSLSAPLLYIDRSFCVVDCLNSAETSSLSEQTQIGALTNIAVLWGKRVTIEVTAIGV
jgi:hypothetical protein